MKNLYIKCLADSTRHDLYSFTKDKEYLIGGYSLLGEKVIENKTTLYYHITDDSNIIGYVHCADFSKPYYK